jgi:hypothetical protein
MDYVSDDKPSKRSHLKQLAKATKVEPEFEDEDLPDEVAYFRRLFFEIWDSSRGLTYQNLYYWMKIYGIELKSDVIEMLKVVSGKANEFISKKIKDKK